MRERHLSEETWGFLSAAPLHCSLTAASPQSHSQHKGPQWTHWAVAHSVSSPCPFLSSSPVFPDLLVGLLQPVSRSPSSHLTSISWGFYLLLQTLVPPALSCFPSLLAQLHSFVVTPTDTQELSLPGTPSRHTWL